MFQSVWVQFLSRVVCVKVTFPCVFTQVSVDKHKFKVFYKMSTYGGKDSAAGVVGVPAWGGASV